MHKISCIVGNYNNVMEKTRCILENAQNNMHKQYAWSEMDIIQCIDCTAKNAMNRMQ